MGKNIEESVAITLKLPQYAYSLLKKKKKLYEQKDAGLGLAEFGSYQIVI